MKNIHSFYIVHHVLFSLGTILAMTISLIFASGCASTGGDAQLSDAKMVRVRAKAKDPSIIKNRSFFVRMGSQEAATLFTSNPELINNVLNAMQLRGGTPATEDTAALLVIIDCAKMKTKGIARRPAPDLNSARLRDPAQIIGGSRYADVYTSDPGPAGAVGPGNYVIMPDGKIAGTGSLAQQDTPEPMQEEAESGGAYEIPLVSVCIFNAASWRAGSTDDILLRVDTYPQPREGAEAITYAELLQIALDHIGKRTDGAVKLPLPGAQR